jgi:hypothetical protein
VDFGVDFRLLRDWWLRALGGSPRPSGDAPRAGPQRPARGAEAGPARPQPRRAPSRRATALTPRNANSQTRAQVFDADGNGKVDEQEWQRALGDLGPTGDGAKRCARARARAGAARGRLALWRCARCLFATLPCAHPCGLN